ncbi:unnamed protein product [Clonostachys byssicola]|uniref:Calmodulin n=1 Tax=Clonostachys byssicola TaxID=160290 RepID=A0A9N9UT33_9HYPO|nr:unnamed protein product [Clonostachys byssicola]
MSTLSQQEIDDYKEAFQLFDKDGDGEITTAEIGEIMKSLGLNPSEDELEDILNEVDVDKNGSVDFNEFVAMMSRKHQSADPDQELRDAFNVFDRDGTGTISRDELKNVMKSIGEHLTEDELDEMLKLADENGDGQIDYDEFVKIMGHGGQ